MTGFHWKKKQLWQFDWMLQERAKFAGVISFGGQRGDSLPRSIRRRHVHTTQPAARKNSNLRKKEYHPRNRPHQTAFKAGRLHSAE